MKRLSTKRKRHSDKKARKGNLPKKPRQGMSADREAIIEWRYGTMMDQLLGWGYKSGP